MSSIGYKRISISSFFFFFLFSLDRLAEYLGWDSEELMGQSVFEFHHALDNLALDKSFKSRKWYSLMYT